MLRSTIHDRSIIRATPPNVKVCHKGPTHGPLQELRYDDKYPSQVRRNTCYEGLLHSMVLNVMRESRCSPTSTDQTFVRTDGVHSPAHRMWNILEQNGYSVEQARLEVLGSEQVEGRQGSMEYGMVRLEKEVPRYG